MQARARRLNRRFSTMALMAGGIRLDALSRNHSPGETDRLAVISIPARVRRGWRV